MVKKVMYSIIGSLVGVLFYINLASAMSVAPVVKTERFEFVKVEDKKDTSWIYDNNEYVEVFAGESYHMTKASLGSLRNNYLFPNGRLNPMEFWKGNIYKPTVKDKTEDKVIENSTKQAIDVQPVDEGGPSLPGETNSFNIDTKSFETLDIDKELALFRTAQMPIAIEGYKVTSTFGKRIDPVMAMKGKRVDGVHSGYDIVNSEIKEIIPGKSTAGATTVLDGVIVKKENDIRGYGNYVEVDHGEFKTLYAHLDSFSDGIKIGDKVSTGDLLGYVGTTGNSTGPHLHFEIIKGSNSINPEPFIEVMLAQKGE